MVNIKFSHSIMIELIIDNHKGVPTSNMLHRTPNAMKSWNQVAKVYPISDVLH